MALIEQRPLYGIGTVARLSGIKTDTLRAWERRYGLGASHKADNGRRLYSQTDLEHLQIVSRLVGQGFRIGEIAAMERKTLAAILEQGRDNANSPAPRLRALFVGEGLCSWLDRHSGCLSGLDATLLRSGVLPVALDMERNLGSAQILVVEAPVLGSEQEEALLALRERLAVRACAVFYEFASQLTLSRLAAEGVVNTQLPLETGMFASTIKHLVASLEVQRGVGDSGEFVALQPRLFQDSDLRRLLQASSKLDCGCSRHVSEIVRSLVHFEQYSSQCSVENWRDAATHTCVYAYTNQARWLMEKALTSVVAEHAYHEKHCVA